jgi:hypothetical protein
MKNSKDMCKRGKNIKKLGNNYATDFPRGRNGSELNIYIKN